MIKIWFTAKKKIDSQQNWAESREFSHTVYPYTYKISLSIFAPDGYIYYKQWCNSIFKSPSVQFSRSCPTLCNPMDCSTPALPVHHQLPEFAQSHIHWVGDAIQPSHPLSSPSLPTFSLCQHQGLFKWVSSLHQVAKVLEFQLQHQSFQWICKTDFL